MIAQVVLKLNKLRAKCIFYLKAISQVVLKLWAKCIFCLTQNIRKKGHNLKNIDSRVMGLVADDVEFDGEHIVQVLS